MWRTDRAERTLKCAEATLFADALSGLLDEAIASTLDDYELGIGCFDDLTFGQRISTLVVIGNGLLGEDVPPVDSAAVVEGAIATVFQHLKCGIVCEIDEPELLLPHSRSASIEFAHMPSIGAILPQNRLSWLDLHFLGADPPRSRLRSDQRSARGKTKGPIPSQSVQAPS
jgi:hypothetical protein